MEATPINIIAFVGNAVGSLESWGVKQKAKEKKRRLVWWLLALLSCGRGSSVCPSYTKISFLICIPTFSFLWYVGNSVFVWVCPGVPAAPLFPPLLVSLHYREPLLLMAIF
jgi:hypothetical protein